MKTNFGDRIIKTKVDMNVDPGHQIIMVGPADNESAAILFALTGVPRLAQDAIIDGDGQSWLCAPHDARADARLVALVDLCADLRFTAPHMMQLRLVDDGA